ncbi:MAG: TetR family transcriptional regulator, partial [Actinomycetes bacterium]
MTSQAASGERRAPLSRERVLRAAIALADEAGIESLTMRRLGQELGVEAMSLYRHVANKDDILDGIVDLVLGDIDV